MHNPGLIIIALLSVACAVCAFIKAVRMHARLEDHHPGFSDMMRRKVRRGCQRRP
ncbi:MAG TPA: hypothetical protein VIR65_14685 [Rhizorhapis sp.]